MIRFRPAAMPFVFALALVAPTSHAASSTPEAAARTDAWPKTPAGEVARGWVKAFGAGEDSMRAFFIRNLSAQSLAERGMSRRLERYRELHEKLGKLQFDAITESKPHEVRARLVDADAKPHEFVFKVKRAPPHLLESVGMLQTQQGGHGFGGFHH